METRISATESVVSIMIVDGLYNCPAVADMDFMGDKWWLARLVVKKSFRGKGLGRQLVEGLKKYARGFPIEVMPGGYDITKKEQFAFYGKCGFRKVDANTMILETVDAKAVEKETPVMSDMQTAKDAGSESVETKG